jgi:hypothetical protein
MSQSEKEEILDRFMIWMRSLNAAGGFVSSQGASYSQFKLWFLRTSAEIERQRKRYPMHPGGYETAKLHHKADNSIAHRLDGDHYLAYQPQHKHVALEVEFNNDFALDGHSSSSDFSGRPDLSSHMSDSDSNPESESDTKSMGFASETKSMGFASESTDEIAVKGLLPKYGNQAEAFAKQSKHGVN